MNAAITSRIAAETSTIELELDGVPPITDAFGESMPIAGLRILYRNREVTVIRFKTANGEDLFIANDDMAPENWPTWLRDLIDQYRPVERRDQDV